MATPRVSVIIPCHNYGRFLGEALTSIDSQTRPADEVIVCDDASTDDSWELAAAEASERPGVKLIRNPTNLGLIRTFNRLVEESTGEIIVTLSADDRLAAPYLEDTSRAIVDRGWDFAYTDRLTFGAVEEHWIAPEFDPVLLLRNNYIAAAAAFRREVFDEIGGYRPSFEQVGMEDWDFWMSAVEAGFVGGRVPGHFFEWRRHDEGSRNTISEKQRIRLRWTMLRHHPRFYLHPRSAEYLWRMVTGGVTNVG